MVFGLRISCSAITLDLTPRSARRRTRSSAPVSTSGSTYRRRRRPCASFRSSTAFFAIRSAPQASARSMARFKSGRAARSWPDFRSWAPSRWRSRASRSGMPLADARPIASWIRRVAASRSPSSCLRAAWLPATTIRGKRHGKRSAIDSSDARTALASSIRRPCR